VKRRARLEVAAEVECNDKLNERHTSAAMSF